VDKRKIVILSIIIPTFNRNELLEFGLQSLDRQIIPWDYEILVLNEFVEDESRKICKKYKNVKYVLTRPEENEKTIKWRGPGYAINFGVKLVKSPVVILACPETYHLDKNNVINIVEPLLKTPKLMTYTEGYDDKFSRILRLVREEGEVSELNILERRGLRPLNTQYPFFLGMKRNEFISIGGYDEEFQGGYCWDDTDFVNRMVANGCKYLKVPGAVVHLYHPRLRYNLLEVKKLWDKNEKLYKLKYGEIVRNKDKEWGVLGNVVPK
jgi:glycosyltransferase involved in cell wall biosynthesis